MEQLHCPKCHKPLISGKEQRYETLSEHVCDPNNTTRPLRPTLVCNNINCPASKEDIFWDSYGDFYGWNKKFEFDDDINSAFPSNSRKLDIEIYKKGLKKEIRLHPALMLWLLQPIIEFKYKADEYGNVLKRWWIIKWLKKDKWYKKDEYGYHIYYTFPLVHIYSHIKYNIRLLTNGSDVYLKSESKEIFKPLPKWDKRWWRYVEKFIDKIILIKYYVIYLENKDE